MQNFIVSARKYRPATFEEVVGQESVTTTLKKAISNNQIAHAYLFCGPRGVGKTTCARILAKEVNQLNDNQTEDMSLSLSIYELDAASNNSVDDIKSLVDQVRIPPQTGDYKIYIIDEVHMLSSSAFNAFLKTLEEPPPYAIFILATTEKHKILPTILSRCQIFDFARITVEEIVNHLKGICEKESIKADEAALHIIAQKADGALRDALSMLDRLVDPSTHTINYESTIANLNILDYEYYFDITEKLLVADQSATLLLLDEVIRKGFDGGQFMNGLCDHFRNLMVTKSPETTKLLDVAGGIKSRYQEQAGLIPHDFLLSGMSISNKCEIEYKASNNKRLTVELALLKICNLPNLVDLSKVDFSPSAKKKPVEPVAQKEKEDTVVLEEKPEYTPKQSPAPDKSTEENTEVVKEEMNEEEPQKAEEVSAERQVEQEQDKPQEPVKEEQPQKTAKVEKPASISPEVGSYMGPISFSEINQLSAGKSVQESEEAKNDDEVIPDSIEIDQDLFDNAWKKYADLLEQDKRIPMHQCMSFKPHLEGGDIKLTLNNKLQKELFANESPKLVTFLESELNVRGLSLVTMVDKKAGSPTKRIPYTSKEKIQKMAESNPSVMTLLDKLDLKPEY